MTFENDGLVLPPEHVQNFLFLGNARQGLIDDLEFFQRLRRGVKLTESTIDQNQAGKRLAFFLQAAIAALDSFLHAGKIVPEDSLAQLLRVRVRLAADD